MADYLEHQRDPHIRKQALDATKRFREFEDEFEELDLDEVNPQSAQILGATYIARKAEEKYLLGRYLDTPEHPMFNATFAKSASELQQIIARALQGDYLLIKIHLWELSTIERNEKLKRVFSRLSELMDGDGPKFQLPEPFAEKNQGGE